MCIGGDNMENDYSNIYKNFDFECNECLKSFNNIDHEQDLYTKQHSDRVASYAVLIGEKLNLSSTDLNTLRLGATYHDIGKVGVSAKIVFKDSKLTDDEYIEMKKHTFIGTDILSKSDTFKDIIPIVKYHHERYDGRGYPEGLKGEEIPLLTRIVSVADTFDAMTSNRVYRNALDMNFVKSEIANAAGTQLDPYIANAFLDILNNESDKIEQIKHKFDDNNSSVTNKFFEF